MFDWGVLKRGVPESVRFCIGDLPMYTFLVPTHPYSKCNSFPITTDLLNSENFKVAITQLCHDLQI